ncbi:YjiH family protein [Atopobacter phocae]|uniref:YjiH family protein n=1 Tax=Atopobacter phocae TaxID=136492 RepID=UPI000472A8C7|nr:nucleoside recognition domain-containing protein [Atopobacter phocae]
MERVDKKAKIRFIIMSILGIFLFLVPLPYRNTFTIPISILIDLLKQKIQYYLLIPSVILMFINVVMSILYYFKDISMIKNNKILEEIFDKNLIYLLSRIIGFIITAMYTLKFGPSWLLSKEIAGTMVELAISLVPILCVISLAMPLLTEFGIMEFVGTLVSKYIRFLFKVPGRAAVDLITSWLGASNAAVLLTKHQYDNGYYTGKEAAIIMTNFSLVSLPFCYVVADLIGVSDYFFSFYLIVTVTGVILAIIMPRIYPLSNISNTYYLDGKKKIKEDVPKDTPRIIFALSEAANRAAMVTLKGYLTQSVIVLLYVLFGLMPIIVCWGSIALLLVNYTNIFSVISIPINWYLRIFGIEVTKQVGSATLVGFVDMFLPPLILSSIQDKMIRFIIGATCLLQLIYMTEVGAIIVKSNVPLNFKDLVLIFLERTIIALPIIIFLTKKIVGF